MRAVTAPEPGGPEALRIVDRPSPVPAADEVVLRVRGTAVNRADTLQRMGFYPPPPGTTDVLGLECSGTIETVGADVDGWAIGDRACALLAGGGYAEQVAVPAGQLLPVPEGMDLLTAAAVPEAFLTAHDNLATRARLVAGETVLVHGGSGGVGTAAIQVARLLGCRVITTAGSPDRLKRCRELGADGLIDHRRQDLLGAVRELTAERGVDVILDVMGAATLGINVACLAPDGRLVVIGLQGGSRGEIDLGDMLRRRASLICTTLRGRPAPQKAEVVARATAALWEGFADGRLRPVVDRVLPLAEVALAHRLMESGAQFGKLVLEVSTAD